MKQIKFSSFRTVIQALRELLNFKADKDKVVSSVNGQTGNVQVAVPALPDNIVQSINGAGPDAEGNVQVREGVTSWNDLQDRPFGEEKTVIEWDGVIGDRASVVAGEEGDAIAKYVKVAPAISREELIGATMMMVAEGTEVNAGQIKDIKIYEYNGILTVTNCLMVVPAPYSDDSMTISEAGTYFYCITTRAGDVTGYVSKLENTTVKQLDPKFIPESAHYLTDANGVQYKLTVGTDGTLSAVAVE